MIFLCLTAILAFIIAICLIIASFRSFCEGNKRLEYIYADLAGWLCVLSFIVTTIYFLIAREIPVTIICLITSVVFSILMYKESKKNWKFYKL